MSSQRFTDTQKMEAVILAIETTVTHAAIEFQVSTESIRKWRKRFYDEGRLDHYTMPTPQDPVQSLASRIQNQLEGNAEAVLRVEVDPTDPNAHIGFIKEAMNTRMSLLRRINTISEVSNSLDDITKALKVVNESIKMFGVVGPLSQAEYRDEMWRTAQELGTYRDALAKKELEMRNKIVKLD